MDEERRRKLDELEAASRERDRRAEQHEERLRQELIEQASEVAASLSGTNAAQLDRLAVRLQRLGLLDLHDDPEGEVGIALVNDMQTGEVVVAIDTGESMFWEAGRQLIEQQERPDGLWYRLVGEDGEPVEDWRRAGPPPPSRALGN